MKSTLTATFLAIIITGSLCSCGQSAKEKELQAKLDSIEKVDSIARELENKIVIEYYYPTDLKLIRGKGESKIYKKPDVNSPYLLVSVNEPECETTIWSNEYKEKGVEYDIQSFSEYNIFPVLDTVDGFYKIAVPQWGGVDVNTAIDGYVPVSKAIDVETMQLTAKDFNYDPSIKSGRFKGLSIGIYGFEGGQDYKLEFFDNGISFCLPYAAAIESYDFVCDRLDEIQFINENSKNLGMWNDLMVFGENYASDRNDIILDIDKLTDDDRERVIRYILKGEIGYYHLCVKTSSDIEYFYISPEQLKMIGTKKTISF